MIRLRAAVWFSALTCRVWMTASKRFCEAPKLARLLLTRSSALSMALMAASTWLTPATLAAQPEAPPPIEMPLVPVLRKIEANGVKVDADVLRAQSQDLSSRMVEAQQTANHLAGRPVNLDSPKQLQAVLFDELKLPAVVKTPKGQPSTNEEALEAIATARTDAELSRMAQTGTSIAHCPTSQLFLGSGTMPWKRTVASGVNIAIGSDFGGGDECLLTRVLGDAFKVHITEPGDAGVSMHPAEMLFVAMP